VQVEVSDAGNGVLQTSTPIYTNTTDSTTTEAKFVNDYAAASGSITLQGTKTLTGNRSTGIAEGEFTFSVKETVDGVTTEVATGKTQAGGSISFTPISYTREDIGTHTYVISENAGTDSNIVYTTDTVTVTVEVSDTGDEELSAAATYTNKKDSATTEAKFVNAYVKSSLTLNGTKILNGNRGKDIEAGEFTFQVIDENNEVVATGSTKKGSSSSAEIEFTPIEYNRNDVGKTHIYTVSEVKGDDEHIAYATNTQTVIVTIGLSESNTLSIETGYYDENPYLSVMIAVRPWITNTNQSSSISRAKAATGDTETSLAAVSAYGADEDYEEKNSVTFTNTYSAKGSVDLTGTKTMTGGRSKKITADEFTFSVYEGEKKVASGATKDGSNKSAEIKFDQIKYTEADIGQHTYVIREDSGSVDGVTNATNEATVIVTVSDNGTGTLSTEVSYPNGGVTFSNKYTASGSVTLTGTKELTGNRSSAIEKEEFSFNVSQNGAVVATGVTQAGTKYGTSSSAKIVFTPVSGASTDGATFHYTQDDIGNTYTYVISEVNKSDPTIDYATNEITVKVKVNDGGGGALSFDVKYLNADDTEATGGIKFVNAYHIPTPTGIHVDILPYAIVIAIAACLCMLLTISRRKRRSVRRR
jgi:pilin isopeptide linkage protein